MNHNRLMGINFLPDRLSESRAIARSAEQKTKLYLSEMNIPDDISSILFSTPSTEAHKIDYKTMRDRIAGLPPAEEEWVMAKCNMASTSQRYTEFHGSFILKENEQSKKIDRWLSQEKCLEKTLFSERIKHRNGWILLRTIEPFKPGYWK